MPKTAPLNAKNATKYRKQRVQDFDSYVSDLTTALDQTSGEYNSKISYQDNPAMNSINELSEKLKASQEKFKKNTEGLVNNDNIVKHLDIYVKECQKLIKQAEPKIIEKPKLAEKFSNLLYAIRHFSSKPKQQKEYSHLENKFDAVEKFNTYKRKLYKEPDSVDSDSENKPQSPTVG